MLQATVWSAQKTKKRDKEQERMKLKEQEKDKFNEIVILALRRTFFNQKKSFVSGRHEDEEY